MADLPATRPGPGWRHIGGAVYEHSSGMRVHMLGVVLLPDRTTISANTWPNHRDAERMIKINGGNRRRGLMAWGASLNMENCK